MTAIPNELRSIIVERELPHPPEKIWRALTQSSLIEVWMMPNDFQPIVGHCSTFKTDPVPHWNGVTNCEVLVVDPYRQLVYTWNASGEVADGLKTTVTWTLTPTQSGVLLRMEQSGFRPQDEHNFQGVSQAWQRFFDGLERVIAGVNDRTV
jgi:uncharacterized protein YndB with AHSA1/START domain